MQKKYKIGLIGFSIGGQVFHAPFIAGNPLLELYKVTARKPEQQQILTNKYPSAIAVSTVDEIIDDPLVDIVVVATSNDVHFSLTKRALEAGKHVVVEKPFTNTTAEADELIALAKEKGRVLTVHHNARFHSDFKTVKKVIQGKRLGSVVNYQARYDRFRNFLREGAWREQDLPGSGIHYDLGAHLIDQALQLFGKPDAVFADLRKQREHAKAIDDFEFILSYPTRKISLFGQMLAKESTPRFAIYGLQGSFVKPGVDPQEEKLRNGALPHKVDNWGLEDESTYGRLNVIENRQDVRETIPSEKGTGQDFYQNLVEVLDGDAELLITPQQARDVIRILEAAEQSWTEQRVISLKEQLIAY
ncbi:Gfo/Idh/MocA family oxidoreductase [Sphingobacterium sp. DN00404]|uniref:Gfo/Idh/MocA family oxidoreductase n=1 Tax=Sphingobacterium micropteri TaxID=2763501 RepID=A0ABR7YSV2_9SPHI|nr:Gfo/Idh/MocA family oxidoreductase [Sphingobacterium micropteri]MBD1434424.1 Gfo/Idh/MocA family oxidoreductase [Sphingobacterium micropteri]